jgi:hypothetical protein
MKSEGVSSDMFLLDWNLSLYAKALHLEATTRLWDAFLGEGDAGDLFLARAALGILRMLAPQLCTLSIEGIMSLLVNLPQSIDPDVLLENIKSIPISKNQFYHIRQQFITQVSFSTTKFQYNKVLLMKYLC